MQLIDYGFYSFDFVVIELKELKAKNIRGLYSTQVILLDDHQELLTATDHQHHWLPLPPFGAKHSDLPSTSD